MVPPTDRTVATPLPIPMVPWPSPVLLAVTSRVTVWLFSTTAPANRTELALSVAEIALSTVCLAVNLAAPAACCTVRGKEPRP